MLVNPLSTISPEQGNSEKKTVITLAGISKSFGSRILFEDVSLTFSSGNRYGLTGPNGSGKSTLLKMIMGLEELTTGTVSRPDRVGILRQNIEDFRNNRVIDVVMMGNSRLWQALQERDLLYEGEMTDEVGWRLGELEGIIAEEDGYAAEASAEVLLAGTGIAPNDFLQPTKTLPTDFQFRVLLCQALFGDPQALLLDEPTNHLDLASIGWLEKFLDNYKGAMVVISHDRHFLNSVCTHIADIDYETVIVYPGNYDDMLVTKTSLRKKAEQDAKSKEKKIVQLKEFVAKFGAGTRASQVQSRKKEIERLKPQDLKTSNIQRPYIRFQKPGKIPGKIVLKAEHLKKSYDDNCVINNFSLEVERGQKIGIIGNNGRGKTTLVKILAGQLAPDRGIREEGHQVEIAYFPQNHTEVVAGKQLTAFDWLKEKKHNIYDQEIRSVMGKMLFSGDDAFKKVSSLSGGETARLILAGMMLQEANVLLLDEPNNHLDLEAVSALGWGLSQFEGTAVVVSHDRDLLNSFAQKIVALEKDGIVIYEGSLDDYLKTRDV